MTTTPPAPLSVAELTNLPKSSKTAGKARHDGTNLRLDALLDVSGSPGTFRVFVRILRDLNENFSIGLTYQSAPGARITVILRVNGDHGSHGNPDGTQVNGPHVHTFYAPALHEAPKPGAKMPWAEALDPTYLWGPQAWTLFCSLANLDPSPKLTARVHKLYASPAQLTLGDGFEADDDDEHDDDDR